MHSAHGIRHRAAPASIFSMKSVARAQEFAVASTELAKRASNALQCRALLQGDRDDATHIPSARMRRTLVVEVHS